MAVELDEAWDMLRHIPDPELGVNIVDLGLVYDVVITDAGEVHVTYTLTTLGCGIGPTLEAQMQEVLFTVPGVTDVSATLVFDPPWTRDRMAPAVRELVGEREFQPITIGDAPVQIVPPPRP